MLFGRDVIAGSGKVCDACLLSNLGMAKKCFIYNFECVNFIPTVFVLFGVFRVQSLNVLCIL